METQREINTDWDGGRMIKARLQKSQQQSSNMNENQEQKEWWKPTNNKNPEKLQENQKPFIQDPGLWQQLII